MTYVLVTGWFILPSCPLHQYHFVNQNLTWHEAQAYCRERYTDLATIESMTEVNELIDTVSSSGYNSEVWIGLYTEIDWKWSDGFTGSGADYRNWSISYIYINKHCVNIVITEQWFDGECNDEHDFVCYQGKRISHL